MDRKLVFIGAGVLVMVVVAVLAANFIKPQVQLNGTVYEPKAAEDFTLPTADGGQFRLSEQRGKVVVLFFGFTNCKDICPLTMANMKQVFSQMDGKDAADVRVVLVTVDPDRDTPEVVQAYAGGFNPSFTGLSGTQEELEPVWNQYGIFREVGPVDHHGMYEVSHPSRLTIIDRQGNLRVSFNYDAPWQDILHDLLILTDEG